MPVTLCQGWQSGSNIRTNEYQSLSNLLSGRAGRLHIPQTLAPYHRACTGVHLLEPCTCESHDRSAMLSASWDYVIMLLCRFCVATRSVVWPYIPVLLLTALCTRARARLGIRTASPTATSTATLLFIISCMWCSDPGRRTTYKPRVIGRRCYSKAARHLLNLLATPVTLCQGWQSGSRITPAPYEKAQASEEICKRVAHPGSKLNQKKSVALDVPLRVHACMYVCICAYVLEMNVCTNVSN